MHKTGELYRLFHDTLKTLPKLERYTLGQKIENIILEILELILSASYLPKYKKGEAIRKASDKTDLLKYLVRIAYDTKSINIKRYLLIEEKVLEIGRMLGGWIKSN
ncbi:MAG: four helix bundle protein [Parcubacteria group bacterium]|nr:four helix bundle protein [Parcubacteria group bacterium]